MSSESSIYKDYIEYTQNYCAKYGSRCIVLLQVGAFFEVYGFRNTTTNEIENSEITDFSQICNLNISEKKIIYDDRQVLMAGFRDYTLDKYLQKLTDNQYTAVVYTQQKDGKQITRSLDSIHSPGTYMSYENDNLQHTTNNVACIWIDVHKSVLYSKQKQEPLSKMRDNLVCGIAVANIFTGTSSICEFQSSYIIQHTTFDELERAMVTHSPNEVLFVSSLDAHEITNIVQFIGIQDKTIHRIPLQDSEKAQHCQEQKYISHILSKFYGEESMSICAEFQTFPTATQAFCFLLDFVQEHNPNLVKNIAIPEFHKTTEMILANHTLNQLNIIDGDLGKPRGHLSSVNSFLNKCNSPMGRRRFYHQLVSPTTDESWLQTEYEMTNTMLSDKLYRCVPELRKHLLQVRDIEKICRQLSVKRLYPSSIYYLHQTIGLTRTIHNLFKEENDLQLYFHEKNDIENYCIELCSFLETCFDIEKCKSSNSLTQFEEIFIKPGISVELDNFVTKYNKNQDHFHEIHTNINKKMQENEKTISDTEFVKIHTTEKSGVSLQITKKRGLMLKKLCSTKPGTILENNDKTRWKDISLKHASGSVDEIEIPFLTNICKEMLIQKEQIQKYAIIAYFQTLNNLEEIYYPLLEAISHYISKVDVLQTKAYIAKEYHYCCPSIVSDAQKPFVDAKALRHVLIEHLQTNEVYVANDICLGKDDGHNGILLYGTNAVGKTSFIRAIGISIIMAQAGLFVPCTHFSYKPYHSIFSRILGNDNLFKGLSTFAVEMSELRVILKMADENSLVLGDELCSGTETESALSIFVSGLMHLGERNSSHIFATHFHEIIRYKEIQNLERLSLKHMSVHYDRELDVLVYDRKLQDGPGNRMYGLEVCKSLHLDETFLKCAYGIRSKYFPEARGELVQTQSRYNGNKIRGMCEMCNKEMGQEVHHMQPQKEANEEGFIETSDSVFHKNHVANLMNICETCHDEHHRNETSMVRKKTTGGYKVMN